MEKHNQIDASNKGVVKIGDIDYIDQLKIGDKQLLKQIFLLHKDKTYVDLIKYTYTKYPYFAINSTIANRYLSDDQIELVNSIKVKEDSVVLYTIGYEGVSLEDYLNKLIKNGITILIDVRNNPMSMKYGFNKSQLINSCKSIGIEYIHFPEVGIVSDQRQQLVNQEDYDKLFDKYRLDNLKNTVGTQRKILEILKINKRVALTCFEANICQCHRKHLAEAITKLDDWQYELKHI